MSDVEAVLGQLSIFEHLRPDEVGRIRRRFERVELRQGEHREWDGGVLLVMVDGTVDLEVKSATGTLHGRMVEGDRHGTFTLLTGDARPCAVQAIEDAVIATVDREGFDAIIAEFPAVALPLARELATEVAVRHDLVRQLLELHAEELPTGELRAAVDERRAALRQHGARVTRVSPRALFRRLVVQQGAEPPFWMLVGFLASLGGARLVVHLILKYKLEKQLFALVPGSDPNPMHVHHFNYGLILIAAAGLAGLFPLGRRALRGLALTFGLGAGLVFDEFALFWNLNPEYAQGMSLFAAGIAAAVLLQLAYFRRFWGALVRRAWLGIRGAR
jgi:CRP-like cAMP-binding protein